MRLFIATAALAVSIGCASQSAIDEGTCSDATIQSLARICIENGAQYRVTKGAAGLDSCEGSSGALTSGARCSAGGSGNCEVVCEFMEAVASTSAPPVGQPMSQMEQTTSSSMESATPQSQPGAFGDDTVIDDDNESMGHEQPMAGASSESNETSPSPMNTADEQSPVNVEPPLGGAEMSPVTDDDSPSEGSVEEEPGEMNEPANMDESSCVDGIQNGDETDVDCGGEVCGGCEHGDACESDGDCFHELCQQGLCVEPPCVFSDLGCPELGFTQIDGGWFVMGSESGSPREAPRHNVNISSFQLMRAEVTVGQYRQCVEDGACAVPGEFGTANWSPIVGVRDNHPINNVSWANAQQFAAWVGARLPSEAEWEFAAQGGRQPQSYAWGEQAPNCIHAVFKGCGGVDGVNTRPVCSLGENRDGLCDLAGNVWEWVADNFHDNYEGAPNNGEAWISGGLSRGFRGGSYSSEPDALVPSKRSGADGSRRLNTVGFRLAR